MGYAPPHPPHGQLHPSHYEFNHQPFTSPINWSVELRQLRAKHVRILALWTPYPDPDVTPPVLLRFSHDVWRELGRNDFFGELDIRTIAPQVEPSAQDAEPIEQETEPIQEDTLPIEADTESFVQDADPSERDATLSDQVAEISEQMLEYIRSQATLRFTARAPIRWPLVKQIYSLRCDRRS